jgi:hypothetical protein
LLGLLWLRRLLIDALLALVCCAWDNFMLKQNF